MDVCGADCIKNLSKSVCVCVFEINRIEEKDMCEQRVRDKAI